MKILKLLGKLPMTKVVDIVVEEDIMRNIN